MKKIKAIIASLALFAMFAGTAAQAKVEIQWWHAFGGLVNEQLTTKDMQKELRNNIYIIDRDANEGKGYLYKTNKRPTDTHLKNANKIANNNWQVL